MLVDILVGVGYKGGVEEVLNATAVYLNSIGNRVRVIQMSWLGFSWIEQGVEFYTLSNSGECNITDVDFYVARYRAFVEKNGKPDIVMCAGWPLIVRVARRTLGNGESKILSWLHGNLEAYSEIGVGGYEDLEFADAHLAINHKMANLMRERLTGEVLEVVNPIDESCIHYNDQRNTKKLAFVGRLAVEKNVPFILNALKDASEEWTIDIVGDSDEEGTGTRVLKEYCDSLGISDRVNFHGWQADPWSVLTDNYALALASSTEGSPLVVVEAMLSGMAVITTPTDGVIDKIVPGKNGYLFPFNDKESFLKILSFTEQGLLPRIRPSDCRKSMEYVLGNKPLSDMWKKITESICNPDADKEKG